MPLPVPQVDEQLAIVDAVDAVQASIGAERAYVEHLRSTKAALASVLLTGEVRVNVDQDVAA